jgi:hypothetical protein
MREQRIRGKCSECGIPLLEDEVVRCCVCDKKEGGYCDGECCVVKEGVMVESELNSYERNS